MAHNWLNDTARALNDKIYTHRKSQPTLATIGKWHREYLEQGLDFKMTFYAYKKTRLNEWHQQRRLRQQKTK